MKGSFRKRGCKCKGKKCTCGATWSFRIDLGVDPRTGKRRQKEKGGFKTKAEAEAAAAKLYTEFMQGSYVVEKDILFKDFAEKWLNMYASSGKVKQSTIDIRATRLKKLLEYLGHLKIKNISKLMYQDMLDDLAKQKYARKTISSVHETGSLIFKKAVEMKIIFSDSTQYAKVPTIQKTVTELEEEEDIPKYLEKEELAVFLETARKYGIDERDYVTFLTLTYTGMRIGELTALKWRDIDFEEQTININKTIYNKKGGAVDYTLQTPKTKKSRRTIDVDRIVLDELDKHRARQNKVRMKYRDKYHNEGFVFAKESNFWGYPETEQAIWSRMKRILKLAKLNESLSPHSLRHTHTSLLAEAGVNLETIMERLGHESDTMTKKIYLHVTKARKKEASQKFSELMKSI